MRDDEIEGREERREAKTEKIISFEDGLSLFSERRNKRSSSSE